MYGVCVHTVWCMHVCVCCVCAYGVFKKASESLSVLSPAGGGGSAGHCRPGEGCVFD